VIYVSTFGFVLALAAVVIAGLAWHISLTSAKEADLRLSTLQNNIRALAAKLVSAQQTLSELKRAAPSTLAAEVADLREAVNRLAATHRRFAGRFDARMGSPDGEPANGAVDPDLAAARALQNAPAVAPGRG